MRPLYTSEPLSAALFWAGVPGITAYQATVGGQGGPFAGAAPADPSQGSVLVLVQNGQYDNALAGVKRVNAYQGPAKLLVGQAQNSANASSSQMVMDVRAGDTATLQAANDQVLAALSKVQVWPNSNRTWSSPSRTSWSRPTSSPPQG